MDRFSLNVKFSVALMLVGALLCIVVYLALGYVKSNRVDDLISIRSDELATTLGSGNANEEEIRSVARVLVQQDDLESIAFVSIPASSNIVAISGDGSVPRLPADTVAGTKLQAILDSGSFGPGSGDVEIRPILIGNPFEPQSIQRYIVVFDFNRTALAADLTYGGTRAIAMLIAAIGLLILVSHLVFNRVVITRLNRLSQLDAFSIRRLESNPSPGLIRDEISRLQQHLANLVIDSTEHSGSEDSNETFLPDTLPDVLLRMDTDLSVTESHFDLAEAPILTLRNLSDLLSADVVDYVAKTVEYLQQGDEESFEFSIGIKSYCGLLRAHESDFSLAITESQPEAQTVTNPAAEAADVLSELMTSLPVGIMETDSRGLLRYANRNLFGSEPPTALIGRSLAAILPANVSEFADRAIRDARKSRESQKFAVPADELTNRPAYLNHVVPISEEDELTFFILSVEVPNTLQESDSKSERVATLEEQLWKLELQVSDYEQQIAELSKAESDWENTTSKSDFALVETAAEFADPMNRLLSAAKSTRNGKGRQDTGSSTSDIWSAAVAVAEILDSKLGTNLIGTSLEREAPSESRFHLATLLDELAIIASSRESPHGSRISAFVQPSLPKWLYGSVDETRIAILHMISLAQLVSGRPALDSCRKPGDERRETGSGSIRSADSISNPQ